MAGKDFPSTFPVPGIIAGLKLGGADKLQVLPSPESVSFAGTPLAARQEECSKADEMSGRPGHLLKKKFF